MFALWPMGRDGDILGQNHKILLKNRQILEKKCIIILFSPVSEILVNCLMINVIGCHFLMSRTRFVCSFGHFGAKTTDFLMKIRESVTGQ